MMTKPAEKAFPDFMEMTHPENVPFVPGGDTV